MLHEAPRRERIDDPLRRPHEDGDLPARERHAPRRPGPSSDAWPSAATLARTPAKVVEWMPRTRPDRDL